MTGPQVTSSEELVELLTALNDAAEKSSRKVQWLFYRVSDEAGLEHVLEVILRVSKSVRVRKEVEEFQDIRQDWEDGG